MKKTLQFKTNIQCMGCVSNVTPALDTVAGAGNWKVDIQSLHKELTVSAESLDANKVIAALEKMGYRSEVIEQTV
jgi:copper chaperone